jgi:gliding motility-associated-like protein
VYRIYLIVVFIVWASGSSRAQCGGILEPGFAFLTSSRGCAPFTVNIETLYLSSVPGTQYFVDWGDGTPEETFVQVNPTGVTISHVYPNTSIDCGYDVTIDASNACNPRGSVVPIETQVIVWTNDQVSINPAEFRVCQGFAATVNFTDNSQWNCFPRLTRENNAPRWIQWLYGTGPALNQVGGVRVNSILPGGFPYLNPAPATNPIYPVLAPGQVSLPIQVPATLPVDIGREFEVTLKNWNQCNSYDNNLADGNAFNPVSGNIINGDNAPQIATARIVIVPSPQPDFLTRLGGAGGPIQTIFCIGDDIYFDNETPAIGGASFQYTWEFYDNATGTGVPLNTDNSTNPVFSYATSGQKLIRLSVRDQNAAGNCVAIFESLITLSPSLVAQIRVSDLSNTVIFPDFCQETSSPFTPFNVRFTDVSVGTLTPTTQWRWEFFDENNILFRQEPAVGFSSVALGPFDLVYLNRGIYRVRLIVRDNVTSCETVDEVQVRVFEKPVPAFTATQVCEGELTAFTENSTLVSLTGENISLREWDFDYDGVTFTKDPAFDNQSVFTRSLGGANTYDVALRVTTSVGCSELLVIPVTVASLPLASFTPDVTSGCSVLPVTFTNTSVVGQPVVVDRFVWEVNFQDGNGFVPVGAQLPAAPGFTNTFVYNFENVTIVNQLYDVRLRTVNIEGCERLSSVVTITVFPGTRSGFISTNYSPFNDNCSPQTVDFSVDNQTQSLNPTNYQWRISNASGTIDDLSTGTTPAFSYTFVNTTQAIQDFNVTLTTTLLTGCFGDSVRTIRINPVPSSAFDIDTILFDCNQLQVRLSAIQKGLSNYHWVIQENGIPVVNTNTPADILNYTFTRPVGGDIHAQFFLDTRNFANCNSLVTNQSIVVPVRDNINGSFTITPLVQSLPNRTVTITNTTNPGPWQYLWDLGDGTTSTDPALSGHTYATYGTYGVTLTVTNNVCVERQTQTITIDPIPPIVDFSYDPAAGCAPLTVNFTNLSQFTEPGTYQWDFGVGQGTSGATNPTYTYFEPGTYTVSLSASNITGQRVTEIKEAIIQVYDVPRASFDVKPKIVFIPGGILFTSNLSLGATRYFWDFGDGGTSDQFEPQHKYTDDGIFTIILRAENENGCVDTLRVDNAVSVQKGGQVLIPNAFSPSTFGPSGGQSGGGKNDVFLPLMRGVVEFEMLIFNRWGELLFRTSDPEIGWDGYYQGKLCPQDVYVYKLSAAYDNGERLVRTGDVNLIR